MISIRKYLDAPLAAAEPEPEPAQAGNRRGAEDLASLSLHAYRSALAEMGRSSVDACPATGPALERNLLKAADAVSAGATADTLAESGVIVRSQLQEWGRTTGRHYQQKAGEVKNMLMAMAQTAQSVGECDDRCARRLHAVTAQLQQIATLDDVTAMRSSIEQRAAELKTAIDRMTEEGQAVLRRMQASVASYQTRMEQAEEAVSSDALTRLRSRLCIESQIEQRIAGRAPFCIAIFDIDGFKRVNDTHGHVIGDELLKRFASELRSACRSSDIVGRWGGDEFIVLLDCPVAPATAQVERVSKWVCGNYVVEGVGGPVKLHLTAAVGLAESVPPETMKEMIDRADAAMYRCKTAARAAAARA